MLIPSPIAKTLLNDPSRRVTATMLVIMRFIVVYLISIAPPGIDLPHRIGGSHTPPGTTTVAP